MTIALIIDGQKFEVEEGATILEVAREHGIEIPTLCYHEALQPYGACRLCVVELEGPRGSKLVSSCSYPAEDGAMIKTNSPMVLETRKMIVELLLADCPDVKVVQDLAHEFGIEKPRFEPEDDDCILCGLCVRACKEIVGVSAISLVNRGIDKKVKPPFEIASRDCIGCGTCVLVCPTGAIKLEDIGEPKLVHHWASDFQVVQCRICGDHYLSPEPVTDYERLFVEETQ
jgi:NADH dehydrogenase/NADH:ubiquinone oxidoreductase subunit G